MIIQCMVCFYVVFLSYQMQDLLIEISVFLLSSSIKSIYRVRGLKRQLNLWGGTLSSINQCKKEKKKQSPLASSLVLLLKKHFVFFPTEVPDPFCSSRENCCWVKWLKLLLIHESARPLVQQKQFCLLKERVILHNHLDYSILHPYFFQMTNVCHSKPSNYFLAGIRRNKTWIPSIFCSGPSKKVKVLAFIF